MTPLYSLSLITHVAAGKIRNLFNRISPPRSSTTYLLSLSMHGDFLCQYVKPRYISALCVFYFHRSLKKSEKWPHWINGMAKHSKPNNVTNKSCNIKVYALNIRTSTSVSIATHTYTHVCIIKTISFHYMCTLILDMWLETSVIK